MFWKKNKDKDKEKKMFESPSEVRGSFRVYPSEENPILLKVGDAKLKAVDISAGGISFDNKDFKLGTTYPMQIALPKNKGTYKIETEMFIISSKTGRYCYYIPQNLH